MCSLLCQVFGHQRLPMGKTFAVPKAPKAEPFMCRCCKILTHPHSCQDSSEKSLLNCKKSSRRCVELQGRLTHQQFESQRFKDEKCLHVTFVSAFLALPKMVPVSKILDSPALRTNFTGVWSQLAHRPPCCALSVRGRQVLAKGNMQKHFSRTVEALRVCAFKVQAEKMADAGSERLESGTSLCQAFASFAVCFSRHLP